MKKLFVLAALAAWTLAATAQTPEYREKKYPNGQMQYQGWFLNGKPTGEFKRFHENGKPACVQVFDEKGNSTVEIFAGDGSLLAKGAYHGNRRHGLWEYFAQAGYVLMTETYEKGRRQGESLKFGPEKQVLERMYYKNDLLDGERIQYYLYGNKMAEYHYKAGRLDGPYRSWLDSGDLEEEGAYLDGKKEGEWHYYEYGGPETVVEYHEGKAVNQDQLDKELQQKLDAYDNDPHLPDPETFEGTPEEFFQINP